MSNQQRFEIRDLRNGDWYWIHKAVIGDYTQKVGAVGIIVYSFLASLADSNQSCFPSQKYIAQRLGYSRATINRALKRLERSGLIEVERRGRYHRIYRLLRVRCSSSGVTTMKLRGNTSETQMSHQSYTNNNKRTRNINNIDDNKSFLDRNSFKGFRPKSREELLALDMASALNDTRSLRLYLSYARRYPESLLRRVLGEVKEIPDEKIRKSRAALFNHIIKTYVKEATKNPGD